MKRLLMAGLFVSSILFLSACSGEEAGNEKTETEDSKKQEVVREDVLIFEVDGEEVEQKLVEAEINPEIASKVLIPEGYETKQVDGNQFVAIGTEEYEGVNFFVQKRDAAPDLEKELYNWRKEQMATGGPGTEMQELNLNDYPELKEKYDFAAIIKNGTGSLQYKAFKMLGEDVVWAIVTIKNDEKKNNHEDFAWELIKKVQFPTSVE